MRKHLQRTRKILRLFSRLLYPPLLDKQFLNLVSSLGKNCLGPQQLDHHPRRGLQIMKFRIHDEIRSFGRFIFLSDACEAFNHSFSSFLVEAFHVSGFARLHGSFHEDLEELQVKIFVYLPRQPSVRLEGRNEAANGDHTAIREQFCYFSRSSHVLLAIFF